MVSILSFNIMAYAYDVDLSQYDYVASEGMYDSFITTYGDMPFVYEHILTLEDGKKAYSLYASDKELIFEVIEGTHKLRVADGSSANYSYVHAYLDKINSVTIDTGITKNLGSALNVTYKILNTAGQTVIQLKTGHYLVYDSDNNEKVTLKCAGKNAKFNVKTFENNYLFEKEYIYNTDVYFDFTTLDNWSWVKLELISINGDEDSEDYIEIVGNTDGELIEPPPTVNHITQSLPIDSKNRMIIRNDNLDATKFVRVKIKNDMYGQYGGHYTHFYKTKEVVENGSNVRKIDSQSNLVNGEYKYIDLDAGYQLEIINAYGGVTVEYDDNGYTSYQLDTKPWENYVDSDIPFFEGTDDTAPIAPPTDNVEKSILGYIKWFFDYIVVALDLVTDFFSTVISKFSNFADVLKTLFSFFPSDWTMVFGLSLFVGLILVIFGR